MLKAKSIKVRNNNGARPQKARIHVASVDSGARQRNGTDAGAINGAVDGGGKLRSSDGNGETSLRSRRPRTHADGAAPFNGSPPKPTPFQITDLEAAIQRYSDLYDFAPLPYVSFDRTGRIEEINFAAAQMFGRSRDMLVGLPLSMHVLSADADLFLTHLLRCRRLEKQVTTDVRLKNCKGDVIFAQLSSRPVSAAMRNGALLFQTAIVDVTERTKAEQRLAEQAHLLDLTNDAIIVRDRKDRILYWNNGAEKLYGYSRAEAVGQITHELLKTEHSEPLSKISKKLSVDRHWEGELVHYHKDGRQLTTLSRWSLDQNSSGRKTVLETNTDITDRKRVAQALRQREEFLRRLIDTAPMCIKVVAADGTLLQMNSSGARMLDAKSSAQLEGKCVYDVVARPYRQVFRRFNERICRGTKGSLQFEIVGINGTRRFMETHAAPIRWFDGRRVQLAITNDITERKRAEEAIRDSERRFREIIDALPAAVYTTDEKGRLTHFNQQCVRLSGRVPELGTDRWCVTWKLFYPDGRRMPHDECPMAVALRTGRTFRGAEAIAERPDGTRVWFTPYPTPLRDGNGKMVGAINMLVDITARKEAEQRIRDSEERFRAIVEQSAIGVTRCDLEGRILLANPAFCKLLGYPPAELLGKTVADLTYPADLPATTAVYTRLAKDRMPVEYEKRYVRKDGSIIWVSVSVSTIRDSKGRPESGIGMVIDITERRQAESLLAEAARQREVLLQFVQRRSAARTLEEIYSVGLDTIVETLGCDRASILLLDDENVMRFVALRGLSERYRKAVEGHSPWKRTDKNPQPVCVEDVDLADLPPQLKKTICSEGIRAAAFIPLTAEGRLIGKFMIYYNKPHQFSDEEMTISLNIAGQLGLGIERKRAENALRTSEERHRTIIKQTVAGVAEVDRSGRFQVVNDRYCEITGYARDELLGGLRIHDITHPDDLPTNARLFSECAKHGTAFEVERRYLRKDGEIVDIHNSVSAIRDGTGRVQGIVAVCIDISGRKEAEEALRESEERMRAIVEQAVAGMARSDRDGRIVFANKRLCELLGYSESELLGRDASHFTHPEDMQKTAEQFKRLVKHGKAFDIEKRYIRKDGSIVWVNVSASPIRDIKGKVHSAVAVVVDISDRKLAETQLLRSKEMLEELVQQRTQALRESNRELENEITRRRALEDQILAISDREQQRLAQELHDGLCQELTAIGFMARATAMRVKNHRVLDPEDMDQIATLVNEAATNARNVSRALHHVDVDAAGFVEAIHNLADREIWKTPVRVEVKKGFQITNNKAAVNMYGVAREAVVNANKHAHATEIVIELSRSKGHIVVTVADDGTGLKSGRQSPGLGLHIMDYRARSIGGRLEVDSTKGAGTRISCYLPAET